MKTRTIYFLAFLLLGFSSGEATTKEKIQVVIRGSENNWKMFVFGAYCPENSLHIVSSDPTMIELECK